MMRYMIRVLWVSLIFLLICSCSCAEEATEIEPAHCTASVNDSYTQALSDDSYFTVWYAKRGTVRIEMPENQPAYSMYICFNRQVVPIVIQIPDENGGYSDLATVSDPYLHQVVFLPGVTSVQIRIVCYNSSSCFHSETRISLRGSSKAVMTCCMYVSQAVSQAVTIQHV